MEEPAPSRHRRRERRRSRSAPAPQPVAAPDGGGEAGPASDERAGPGSPAAPTTGGSRTAGTAPAGTAPAGTAPAGTAPASTPAETTAAGIGGSGGQAAGTPADRSPASEVGEPEGDAGRPAPTAPASKRKPRSRRTDAERSLRGIVGAGSSQVGVTGAMRARDAARPTAEDLAAAERDLVIVRRHYVPPDPLPGAR